MQHRPFAIGVTQAVCEGAGNRGDQQKGQFFVLSRTSSRM